MGKPAKSKRPMGHQSNEIARSKGRSGMKGSHLKECSVCGKRYVATQQSEHRETCVPRPTPPTGLPWRLR